MASTKTHLAVLEALVEARAAEIDRRLQDMNHWRAEEIADKAEYLRSAVYEKSEDLHRQEVAARDGRIATLEIRITQVATVGAIAVLLATILTPIAVLWLSHYMPR